MVSVYGVLETRVRSGVLIIAGHHTHIFRIAKNFFGGRSPKPKFGDLASKILFFGGGHTRVIGGGRGYSLA